VNTQLSTLGVGLTIRAKTNGKSNPEIERVVGPGGPTQANTFSDLPKRW